MKLKIPYKTYFSIFVLTVFSFTIYGQEITLIDIGDPAQLTIPPTNPNWNNIFDQNEQDSYIDLFDITGSATGETLTLTDIFNTSFNNNNQGTTSPTVSFGGSPLPITASRDSFFGESSDFNGSTQPTGGFTLSGLEAGKYYSFKIFASRVGGDVTDNRETLYTITGNTSDQATLDAALNTLNVAVIANIQPDINGEIIIQAETGPSNTNSFGFYYLGAIEMTKTDCASTVTWNGSVWSNGTGPDSSTEAIINNSYTTNVTNGSFTACSLIINSGATLTVTDGFYVEIENDVVVDGQLFVDTQGNFVQRDDLGTFTVNPGGFARVTKQTSTKAQWYYYTYWSSPVVGWTIADAFPNAPANRRFWFNAANFVDTNGDDIDDDENDWQIAPSGDIMLPGVGYAATEGIFHVPNGTGIASFDGQFNTGDVPVNIDLNVANTGFNWNFIGNPYPSAIDFDAFYSANSLVIDGTAYFWSQASPPNAANPGNQVFNFNQNDYAMYAAGSGAGVAGASGIIPTQYIPSAQGFFIAGLTSGPATFTNAMRMADGTSNSQFFKSSDSKNKSNTTANRLWINLTSDNGVFNQILTAYVNRATNGDDGMAFDAPRLLSGNFPATLYSTIENSNKKFAIQGKDANSLNTEETIQLGFKTNIKVATQYKLSIPKIEGDFLTNNTVYLKDNLLNKVHNLSDGDYSFTSGVGEFNERFVVGFNFLTLSNDEFVTNANTLKIVDIGNDRVTFKTSNNLKIKNVAIFDLLGRQLYQFKGQNSEETYTLSALKQAIYIAKVELSNGAIITKKAIKK